MREFEGVIIIQQNCGQRKWLSGCGIGSLEGKNLLKRKKFCQVGNKRIQLRKNS